MTTSDLFRSTKQPIVQNPQTAGFRQTVPTSTQNESSPEKKLPYSQGLASDPSSSPIVVPGGVHATESTLTQGFGRLAIAAQPRTNQTINVVLFGEPGVGKSAVVNLIARKNIARVPSGVRGFQLQSNCYDIRIDDTYFFIFETVGLKEPEISGNDHLVALEMGYELARKLIAAGGVHLLLFCIRADRWTATTESNHRLFSEVVFLGKVPTVFIVTGLEEEEEMEDWWTRNKTFVEYYGLKNDGHACITSVTDRSSRQDHNYAESQKRIRELLKTRNLKTSSSLPELHDWFLRLGSGMQQFINEYGKPTRGEIMDTLENRLKLDPKTVQRFLDMMDRGGGRPSTGSRPRCTAPPKSSTTSRFQDLDPVKRSDEPQRVGLVETARSWNVLDPEKRNNERPGRKMTGELPIGQSQSQYSNAAGEEDKGGQG
ncbi:hypothetical protein V8E55_007850 [Tylopilus felleus]